MTQNDQLDEAKNMIEITISDEIERRLIGTVCDAVIRLAWLSFIDPDMPQMRLRRHLAREGARVSTVLDEALEALKEGIRKVLRESISASRIPKKRRRQLLDLLFEVLKTKDGKEQLPKLQKLRSLFSVPIEPDGELQRKLHVFSELGRKDDTAFVRLLGSLADHSWQSRKVQGSRDTAQEWFAEAFGPHFAAAAADWVGRVKPLTPELISTVPHVRVELIEWLARHPTAISSVAWDAFEKIIAELLASKGFQVQLTARTPNASADVIAIRRDSLGVETKYLVECKRFQDNRRVGLSIVNGVLGARLRAGADHALLVTTSDFTRRVRSLEESLQDLRLHLRDGENVREWLSSYEPAKHGGLWLDPDWDLDKQPDE